MLCLACLERRLGRPLLLEDFKVPDSEHVAQLLARKPALDAGALSIEKARQSDEAFDDSPMDWDDYGIYDDLSPDTIGRIDAALRSEATAKPRKVTTIIRRVRDLSPAGVPGLHDYFYLERLCLLVESDALIFVGDFDNPMRGEVHLP